MQPTNEQVVAACQRAGIPVRVSACAIRLGDLTVIPTEDSCPGSALFIVAVLRALGEGVEVHHPTDKTWMVVTKDRMGFADNTLTAACMAAIVAAYPEVREGGQK